MMRLLLVIALLVCAPAAAATPEPVEVTVTRTGGTFVAEFAFPRSAAAWGFFRSSVAADDRKPWRPASWQVLTPGVSLERRGRHDALVATGGGAVPRKVRVRVKPFLDEVVADYVPALRLGGSSIALFDGHFSAFSVDRADALGALPQNPDSSLVGDGGTRVRFAGPSLRIAGDVEGYRNGNSSGAYGLFGVPPAVIRDGIATVIDRQLPQWLAIELSRQTARVIERFTASLGPAALTQPTILAAWEGEERKGANMNGGTLKGLILMRFDGAAAKSENPALSALARWFVAHEAAHFWLGHEVSYSVPQESWITEGGADLLAYRAVAAMDPAYDVRAALQKALDKCLAFSSKGGIAAAGDRGDHEAYYHCGTIIGLVAERASGGDFGTFVKALIEDNRDDRQVTRSEWLAALDARAPGKGLSGRIAILLDGPGDHAQWAALLASAGIPHNAPAGGKIRLQ